MRGLRGSRAGLMPASGPLRVSRRNPRYFEDANGHIVEATNFDEKDGSIRYKYRYKYEFDSRGNWITKTTEKWVTKNGKSDFEPARVTYRSIEYY